MDELIELKEWARERYEIEVTNQLNEDFEKEILKGVWNRVIKKLDEMIINY